MHDLLVIRHPSRINQLELELGLYSVLMASLSLGCSMLYAVTVMAPLVVGRLIISIVATMALFVILLLSV